MTNDIITFDKSFSSFALANNDNNDQHHDKDNNNMNVVSWHAPFLSSSSGYGSEATSFLVGLNSTLDKSRWKLAAGVSHGDSMDYDYIKSLSEDLLQLFVDAEQTQNEYVLGGDKTNNLVVIICHSEPGAWSTKDGPHYESPVACPPPRRKHNDNTQYYYIGRTMFETDRLPTGWSDRMNELMDEIWVPTKHHQRIFERDGVTKPKVVVVGQGINVQYWNPDRVLPLEDDFTNCKENDYKFLSVFKWETRKAPDILLKSFWNEFIFNNKEENNNNVCLIIVTSSYHDNDNKDRIQNEIQTYWEEVSSNTKSNNPQSINKKLVLLSGLSLEDLVRLYRTVDAFVLPSRGEGWGRPYMEAMAMGLPVIATNWSGPTEFVSDDVGYLLPILDELVDAELEAFPNHKWAEPNQTELQRLLRYIERNRDEAKEKGTAARKHIIDKWSNDVVSQRVVTEHLERIAAGKAKQQQKDEL